VGVVIANTADDSVYDMVGSDPTIAIGALLIGKKDGDALRAVLPTLHVTMASVQSPTGSDSVSPASIAHEWMHYMSIRLIADGTGISAKQAGGLGEGWADFNGLLMLVKESDRTTSYASDFGAAFPLNYFDSNSIALPEMPNYQNYYGGRLYPFSRDLAKDPLTFRNISNAFGLPTSPPPNPFFVNIEPAEVHNTGDVWTSMLWDCYSNLLNDTPRLSFEVAQARMKQALVTGFKIMPANPTFTEARDALLAALQAVNPADEAQCRAGFAKRGLGVGAVAPDRFALDNAGVVESFAATGGAFATVGLPQVSDAPGYCDADGFLDDGETGTLTATFLNTGTQSLTAARAHATASSAAISFPDGDTINVPATSPGELATVSIPVKLTGLAARDAITFSVTISDPSLAVAVPTATVEVPVNVDQTPNASATDDMESTHSVWTLQDFGRPSWRREQVSATDHRWSAGDPAARSLPILTSPLVHVSTAGSFKVTFKHRHNFEADEFGSYDGGFVLMNIDGDFYLLDPSFYNGTISTDFDNPRAGYDAYVATNAAFPSMDTVTLDFGTDLQGAGFQISFIAATDSANFPGDWTGWQIDDIVFDGIDETPFDVTAADAHACVKISTRGGTPQSAVVNTAFASPLQALVTDASDTPLAGAAVVFKAPASGPAGLFGATATVTVATDAGGIATAPSFTANTVAGSYAVAANAGAQAASFALTNLPGPALLTAVSGTPQSAIVNTAFAVALKARVADSYGNPYAATSVTFAAPPAGASAVFGGSATVATDGSGYATAPALTANATAGSYTATATSAATGAATVSFALKNVAVPVTSVSGPAPGGGTASATLSGGGALCGFAPGARFIPASGDAASPPALPSGVVFPQGLFVFTTTPDCTPGSTITITLTFPDVLAPGTRYWKYGPTADNHSAHWYVLPATIAGHDLTFTIGDGQLGDDDLAANGTIVDPGGPGVAGAVQAIPALQRLALLAMMALLALGAGSCLRRR
jgi:hypothetical protein